MSRNNNDKNSNNNHNEYNKHQSSSSEAKAIIQTFARVVQNKFASTPSSPTSDPEDEERQISMDRLNDLYKSPSYAAEKKILTDLNSNGMTKGLMAGLTTFLILRKGPNAIRRYMISKSSGNRMNGGGNTIPNGYKFDRSPPSSTSNHAKNPFEVAANRSSKSGNSSSSSHTSPGYHEYDGSFQKPGLLLRTLLLGVDVLVATSVAMYSSAIFMDKSKFMKDLSEIPLVEGRSIISDELCEDFIDVYKSIPQKTWKKFEGEGDASVDDVVDVQEGEKEVLEAIGNFVRNCLRRQMYEEELRREEVSQSEWDSSASRHSSSIPIDIPHPGVPPDREVHIAWGDSSEDLKEERILEQHEDLDDSFMGNFHDWSDHGDDDDNDSTKTDFGRSSGKKQ